MSTEWMDQAACVREPPESFFPEVDGDPLRVSVSLCLTCPVRSDCLRYALEHRIQHGIWGGSTEKQRRRLLRGRRS